MPTKISTTKSKEILSRLIRNDFDKIDFKMDYIYGKADELIALAFSYGLYREAEEMINEKNTG